MGELVRLNLEQEAAVAFGEGPLRIMAGAGTGKTFTLTQRIVSLVQGGHARPSEILALTFTNKAAGELTERIDKAVAELPEAAGDRVDIDTYHAFGGRIVTEHAHLLGLPPEPIMLTTAEAWILLWRALDEIDFQFIELMHLRGTGNAKSPLLEMLNLGSRLRDELASLDTLEEYLTVEEESDATRKLGDYLRALRVYERRKREIGAIDYGDQIALACELLARPELAALYHQRYRYLLVDEFQDTNYAQSVMVRRLASGPEANVCVVGDPNQAIYSFRGASPDNLERFAIEEFPRAVTLALKQNFRSTPDILAVANAIWEDDGDPFHGNLIAASPSIGKQPVIVDCERPEDEIAYIADEIDRQIAAGRAFREIAVIARKNKIKEMVYQGLRERRIPCEVIGGASLYSTPEVRELISYLRTIGDPADDPSLAHVLFAEQWGLDERSLFELARNRNRDESLLTAVKRVAALPDADPALCRPLDAIELLTERSYKVSLGRLVEEIVALRRGGYDEIEQINVQRFVSVVRAFAESRVEDPQLSDLLAYLDLLLSANPEDEAASGLEEDDANTVKIMTSHASKGLEWNVVFVCGANKNDFRTTTRQDILPAELAHPTIGRPDAALFNSEKAFDKALGVWRKQQHDLEELRVLYVALTRAKQELTISWSKTFPTRKNDTVLLPALEPVVDLCRRVTADPALMATGGVPLFRDVVPGMFKQIDAMLDSVTHRDPLDEALAWRWGSAGGDRSVLDHAIARFLRERETTREQIEIIRAIERRNAEAEETTGETTGEAEYGVSYSQLESFKRCPHHYYLRYVARTPTPPSHRSTAVGTAFHEVIAREAELRKNGIAVDSTVVDAMCAATPELAQPEVVTGSCSSTGSRVSFQANYVNSVDFLATPLLVEAPFTLKFDTVSLYGVIDRVHRLPDGMIEVVDYKTDQRVRTEQEVREGWQLPIYLLACRDVFTDIQPTPTRAVMFFVRANTRIVVEYTDAELSAIRANLTSAVSRLRAVQKQDHCASAAACANCDYRFVCTYSEAKP